MPHAASTMFAFYAINHSYLINQPVKVAYDTLTWIIIRACKFY